MMWPLLFFWSWVILLLLLLGSEIPLELTIMSLYGKDVEYVRAFDDLNSPASRKILDILEREVRLMLLFIN